MIAHHDNHGIMQQQAPKWYSAWHASVEVDGIEYGVGGIELVQPEDMPNAQLGYALPPRWLVIGHETACGDPIFASHEEPHPVFTAMHGVGTWEPSMVAPSLELFRECLAVFGRFAQGRGSPVELEGNSPSEKELEPFQV